MFFVSDYEAIRCFEWTCTYMIDVFKSYHVKSGPVHIWKIPLSHITAKGIKTKYMQLFDCFIKKNAII